MQTRWFKGLNEQEEKDLRAGLVASDTVLRRLGQLLQEDLTVSAAAQLSGVQYESPSWAYQQADFIGQQRVYTKILRLINKEK